MSQGAYEDGKIKIVQIVVEGKTEIIIYYGISHFCIAWERELKHAQGEGVFKNIGGLER
jgi:hypothetical protein